jgi:hypothetical protein
MKSIYIATLLGVLANTVAIAGNGTSISIVNDSHEWLQVYRLGAPEQKFEVQKRWDQVIEIPLVENETGTMQMLEILRESSDKVTPETSFSGFNGSFAQDCELKITDTSISIKYGIRTESTNSTSNSNSSNTSSHNNSTASGARTAGAGGSYPSGGGGYGNGMGGGYPPGSFHQANSADITPLKDDPQTGGKPPVASKAPKKQVLAGGTGVRVKIANGDGRVAPPEIPASLPARPKEGSSNAATVSTVPPKPPAKKSYRTAIIWCSAVVIVAALAFLRFRGNKES